MKKTVKIIIAAVACILVIGGAVGGYIAYQLTYQGSLRDAETVKRFLDAVRERNGNLPVSLGSVAENTKDM